MMIFNVNINDFFNYYNFIVKSYFVMWNPTEHITNVLMLTRHYNSLLFAFYKRPEDELVN